MPMRPFVSRKASRSSPITLIFFGGPSRSGSSADNSAGIQKRRSRAPIGVPASLCVRNSLSALLSISSLGGRFCQSLLQIGDDVVSLFEAYRQANYVGARTGPDPLLLGELAVRRRGGMDDQALGVADVGHVAEQLDRVDDLHANVVAALHAEREHRTRTLGHVALH